MSTGHDVTLALDSLKDAIQNGVHRHDPSTIHGYIETVKQLVANDKMTRRSVCAPLSLKQHRGNVVVSMPIVVPNVYAHVSATISVIRNGRKSFINFSGVIDTSKKDYVWFNPSAYITGYAFKTPITVTFDLGYTPSIYIGTEATGWGYNEANKNQSSKCFIDVVHMSLTPSKVLLENSDYSITASNVHTESFQPVVVVNPDGSAIPNCEIDLVFDYDRPTELLTFSANGLSKNVHLTEYDGSWIQPAMDVQWDQIHENESNIDINNVLIEEIKGLAVDNTTDIKSNLVLINADIEMIKNLKIRNQTNLDNININNSNINVNISNITKGQGEITDNTNNIAINLSNIKAHKVTIATLNNKTIFNLSDINRNILLINQNIQDISNLPTSINNLSVKNNNQTPVIDKNLSDIQQAINLINSNISNIAYWRSIVSQNTNKINSDYNYLVYLISIQGGINAMGSIIEPSGYIRFPNGLTFVWHNAGAVDGQWVQSRIWMSTWLWDCYWGYPAPSSSGSHNVRRNGGNYQALKGWYVEPNDTYYYSGYDANNGTTSRIHAFGIGIS